MATWGNKTKLAAVSRETPKSSRSSRGQNVLDPELTQEYISQVSEEIEGRVAKKLSKDFSKTESQILGALSKLDEFLLNPQVRTCSVAAHGTSRNSNSENREIHGDRSSDDPYPEVGYFPHHSGQLNGAEAETYNHMVTENYSHTYNPQKNHSTDKKIFLSTSSLSICLIPRKSMKILLFTKILGYFLLPFLRPSASKIPQAIAWQLSNFENFLFEVLLHGWC